MAVLENRLSTTVVSADFLDPDGRVRTLMNDFEAGPVGINNTTQGLFYQTWEMTYDSGTGDFTVTAETNLATAVPLSGVLGVTQLSFCFDQNARVNIAYTQGGQAKMYWFDTAVGSYVTTVLDFGVTTPHLSLDDKRSTQQQSSDMLLFYTKEVAEGSWNLYHRFQRERFLNEYLYATGVRPYIFSVGMHEQLRVQIGMAETVSL